jgi:short-subunit dehydrogenase
MPERILITGASSGLGASLARAYAAPGASLVLWGRDEARLAVVAASCRALGAAVQSDAFDLRDMEDMAARLTARDGEAPITLAIFNAGVGGSVPRDHRAETVEAALRMASVNFTAPVVGANVIGEAMARRGAGHIVLIGSIAESFPLPMAPTYAGAKAGLAMFAEALGLRLKPHHVAVSLVSPGFIDTPMSQQVEEPKPFLITPDRAAAIIKRKLAGRARRIVVPWQFIPLRAFAMALPRVLLRRILGRIR